ncbi:MAG TPA: polysaccharide biosynthesis/export family protein [Flavipsychrobacter sp.]|nr:polysaccharide biosynthesis/export family protein [Flavipsychrobacter sp.]
MVHLNERSFNGFGLSLFFIGFIILLNSCASGPKQMTYFNNVPDSLNNTPLAIERSKFIEPKIQSKDILQISIQTLDPRSTDVVNSAPPMPDNTGSSSNGGNNSGSVSSAATVPGYLVDNNGEIEMPLVGRVKVGGLTTTEAKDLLREKASQYYKDPVVNVRCVNFVVTVLGEVNHPGQYLVPNEKINLLDAIGLAGDLTAYGKRNDILLVREDNGNKLFIRFDLNSSDIYKSPYFYLQKGDLVYVAPNKSKAALSDYARDRNVQVTSAILTPLIILANLLVTVSRR